MIVGDFEVFLKDWCFCGLDLVNQQEICIVNDVEALKKLYDEHKNDVWIFYNGRNYDQYILKAILCDFNPKEVNDWIILKKQPGYRFSSLFNKIPLAIFDIMTTMHSLKQLEGFMGIDIRETTVPFDIDRKLTDAEMDEVLFYCRHDVEATAMVLNERIEEFTSQLELVKMFDLPRTMMGKTKPQLSAIALGAKQRPWDDELDYCIPENLKIEKYKDVVEWFRNAVEDAGKEYLAQSVDKFEAQCVQAQEENFKRFFYGRNLKIDIAGVPHVFAWGGLHGARTNYHQKGRFINVDVASYYATIMIEYGYESRNIHDPEKFTDMYHTRLRYKAMKDKRANPLKTVLTSTYGAMKDKFNPLYDPKQANNVCVTGQLLLLDLLEHLEAAKCCTPVNVNTDGILVLLNSRPSAYERFMAVCDEWQERSRMKLEFDEYCEIYQSDVNNYVIVDKDGNYKGKGGVAKKLSKLDNDLPILNTALKNYMVKGIPLEKTILECDDLMQFQKICRLSSKYEYVQHNGQNFSEKTFRIFASTCESDTTLYKVKNKGGSLVPEKFANCSEHVFIDNTDVQGKPVPDFLDKHWYIAEAHKRLSRFM